MNASLLTIFTILLLGCQHEQAIAQRETRLKTFDSAFGKAKADLSKDNEFLLTSQHENVLDTIVFWKNTGSITNIWDVKLYSGKCILLLNSSYNFVDMYVFKQANHRWEHIGTKQLMNIDEPHNRNEPKQTITHKNENNVQVFQGNKLIRECIIDYDKTTCRIIEYPKD